VEADEFNVGVLETDDGAAVAEDNAGVEDRPAVETTVLGRALVEWSS
jgi:hypothetical protein